MAFALMALFAVCGAILILLLHDRAVRDRERAEARAAREEDRAALEASFGAVAGAVNLLGGKIAKHARDACSLEDLLPEQVSESGVRPVSSGRLGGGDPHARATHANPAAVERAAATPEARPTPHPDRPTIWERPERPPTPTMVSAAAPPKATP